MAKRNLAAGVAPETKTVRVIEEHSYIKEVPIVDESPIVVTEEPEQPDIFSAFNEIVTTNQNALLRIWLLPKYDIDGRASIHATDREYCGSVPYNSDNAILLDQISGRVPQGGMVQLELFADGAIRKRGLLKLIKSNVPISQPYNGQQGTHLVINQPPIPQQVMLNPAEVMREHMKLAQDLVAMARDLQPPAPMINMGASDERPSMEDRLFETVLVKALESNKTPIDKVLEAMSGRRSEPTLMETLSPIIGEVLKAFAPSINAMIQRGVAQQQATATGLTQPAQLGAAVEPQEPVIPVPIDPVQRDWFQAMLRLLEDCTRHVELASVGGGGKSVLPSAEAILELAERYPEQLGPTITILLGVSPEEVLDSCAMMLDERGQAHVNGVLKPAASALKWIEDLQGECKRIMNEAGEAEPEAATD